MIFSSQLNKIVFMLTDASIEVYYALNRVLFVGKKYTTVSGGITGHSVGQEKKHFKGLMFTAGDMIYNLNKIYVESFSSANRKEIFEETKNPLFILSKTYLQCFFLPVFRRFSQLIVELGRNNDLLETAKGGSNNGATTSGTN